MRLVCPNCGAVYEVPEDNIPAPGRDVQCSACETTWFFERPLDGEDLQPFEKSPRERDADTEAYDTSGETTSAPDTEGEGEERPEPDRTARENRPRAPAHVSVVLKEEAQREAAVRAAEAMRSKGGLDVEETIPDLEKYLEDEDIADLAVAPAAREDSTMQSATDAPAPQFNTDLNELDQIYDEAAKEGIVSKSALFPEIEKVNSSLGAQATGRGHIEDAHLMSSNKRSSSARIGFLTGILLVALAVLTYVYVDELKLNIPELEPYLTEYQQAFERVLSVVETQVSLVAQWMDDKANASANTN